MTRGGNNAGGAKVGREKDAHGALSKLAEEESKQQNGTAPFNNVLTTSIPHPGPLQQGNPINVLSPSSFPVSIANKDRPSVARYSAKAANQAHAQSNPTSAQASRGHTPHTAYTQSSPDTSCRASPRHRPAPQMEEASPRSSSGAFHSANISPRAFLHQPSSLATQSAPASPSRRPVGEKPKRRRPDRRPDSKRRKRERMEDEENEVEVPNEVESPAPEGAENEGGLFLLKRASSSPNFSRTDIDIGARLDRSSSPPCQPSACASVSLTQHFV